MVPLLALCYALALATASKATVAAAGSPQCTPSASIECTLQTAGVRNPAAMTERLLLAELQTVQDVADLDFAEAAELFSELRAASVPLGDRSRLRKVARAKVGERVHSGSAEAQVKADVPGENFMRAENEARYQKTSGSGRPQWERGLSEPRRRLQSGGGISVEVAAIAFTGLIGMVGYVVQARSAQKASEAQAKLDREAAEREKVEAKAGKQLERVQLQMAEWVRPLNIESSLLWNGWIALAKELNLQGYLGLYSIEYVEQPATPYIDLFGNANPAMFAAIGRAPYAQLPPADLALLSADPALRSRYCELAVTVLLPSLRRLSTVFATKFHHYVSTPPARLDALLPGIGRDWASLLGTLATLYPQLCVHAAQFESLAGRWEQEQFDLLQPDLPSMHLILHLLSAEQIKDVATKEVELIGVSSGSRTTGGSLNFMKSGVDSTGDAKEAET
jgi:hypothetical protein